MKKISFLAFKGSPVYFIILYFRGFWTPIYFTKYISSEILSDTLALIVFENFHLFLAVGRTASNLETFPDHGTTWHDPCAENHPHHLVGELSWQSSCCFSPSSTLKWSRRHLHEQ